MNRGPGDEPDAAERARVGLCLTCRHTRVIETPRGSRFHQCRLAFEDPQYAKYPPLPVVRCGGYSQSGE